MKDQAEALRVALLAGVVEPAQVEVWATSMVDQMEQPPLPLLQLVMCGKLAPVEISPLLRAIPGDFDPRDSIRLTFGLAYQRFCAGEITLEKVCRGLYSLLHADSVLTKDEESAIYSFDDGYDLALNGTYSNMATVKQEVLQFLFPYELKASQWWSFIL